MRLSTFIPVLAALLPAVHSLSSTDSPQDGDVLQSGYSSNHNIDPTKLSSYLLKWTYSTGTTSEFFYAKPLVYTPAGASYERIYIVSDMNIVRVLDGATGNLLLSRTLLPPFKSSDTQCGDIPNQIGIIGTPIIDPTTEIMYFWSKSYRDGQVGPLGTPTSGADNSGTGVANGKWQLYAVYLSDLSDAPGFPISIEGLNAHNDRTRYIISGTLNQRPGLAMLGNTIITGFGSHCDNFNFTGYLITASKTAGVGITDIQAMVASPGAPTPQALDLTMQNNGKSGIWQGGFGLAVDASKNQVFFAVGNGQAPGQLNGDSGVPTPGLGNYLSTLENAVANYDVDPDTGKLTQADWFVTTDYDHLNGEDKDIGSSGLALLDPTVFSGGGVNRIAIAAGKIARIIIMDADNLGGFKMGANETDGVLQEMQFDPDNYAFFSGVASYPLEGGYIYFAPTSGTIMAYKFGIVNGAPYFTLAGQTAMVFAGKGAPHVTSLNGQPGTGIVWIADVNQGVQAFNAIPDANGVLQPYTLVQTGRLNKFHRPQFGDETVYTAELNKIYGLGPPLSASSSSVGTTLSTSTTSKTSTSTSASISSSSTKSSSSSIVISSSSTTSSTTSSTQSSSSSTVESTSSTTSSTISSTKSSISLVVTFTPSTTPSTISSTKSSSSLVVTFTPSTTLSIISGTQSSSSSTVESTSSTTSSTTLSSGSPASKPSSSSSTSKISTSSPASVSATRTSTTTSVTSSTGTAAPTDPFAYVGCYQDTSSGHALPLLFRNDSVTPELCEAYVRSLANQPTPTVYNYFYVEYHRECYGGNTFNFQGSSISSLTGAHACTDVCSGSIGATSTGTAMCGGPWQFDLYVNGGTSNLPSGWPGVTVTSTGTSTLDPVTTTSPSSAASPTLGIKQTIGSYSFLGCYTEATNERALTGAAFFNYPAMTLEECQVDCEGYTYFGVEYGGECYCGNVINPGSVLAALTDCSFTCPGNQYEYCGAGNRLQMYQVGSVSVIATSPTTTSNNLDPTSETGTSTSTSTPFIETSPPTTSNDLASTSKTDPSTSSSSASNVVVSLPPTTSNILASTSKTDPSTSSSSTSNVILSSPTGSTTPPYVTPSPPQGNPKNINWSLGWVNAAPDGFTRPVIGINGQWPCPPIVMNYGDTLILSVYNGLGNESTAIHFHGLQQRNTTYADGPSWATQCPVPPGETIIYEFKATQIGTYWFHAHHAGQYIDGLRGPFIVQDPSPPYGAVDQDITLTLTDFYHEEAPYLINYYQSAQNYEDTGGIEPLPDAALINEAQNVKFNMTPGQTNLFRVINMGAMAGQYLQFDGHNMTIVEVDGQYVEPYTVQQLFVAVAQRYTVIVESRGNASTNYAIVATMDTSMFSESGTPANATVSGWLVYNATKPLPAPFTLTPQPWNELAMVPLDQLALFDPASSVMNFAADFSPDSNLIPRALLNGNAYVNPNVPTLYTALTAPAEYLNNPTIYGTGVNPYIIPYGAIVEIQIDNHDDRAHPFHLHGHHFQVIYRGGSGSLFPGLENETPPAIPLRRDTIVVYADNTATIRFVADNPGIQLFHCHTEWHVIGGMTATFIEAPTELVAQHLDIPVSHQDICDKYGISRKGNAAGNSVDWLNLTGEATQAPTSNWGALVNPPS